MIIPKVNIHGMDQHITLQDGRILGYCEIGAARGKPVFYFHGFPGSRLEARLAEKMARETNIKLISIDRPGYGLSQYQSHRTFMDWSDDLTTLADDLGIDRFTVIGVSGGGPYAAACAWKIPERLKSVGIICGLGPLNIPNAMDEMVLTNRLGLHLAGRYPRFTSRLFRVVAFMLRNHSERLVRSLAAKVNEVDRDFLSREETVSILASSFRESVRQSYIGPLHDLILYSRPWGFRLEDIGIQVHLWYGMRDVIVPPGMGHFMSNSIPHCRSHFFENEGHFSILLNRLEDIFGTLITDS